MARMVWKFSLWKYQLWKWLKKVRFGRRFNLKTILFLTLLKLGFVLIYFLYKWNVVCSNYPIHNLLDTVCGQYARGEVLGDLCDKFCGDVATLKVDSCQSWHGGKELVFSATLGGKKVYIKGRRKLIESDPNEQLFWSKSDSGVVVLPDFNTFEDMVNSFLRQNMDIDLEAINEDVFEKLWTYPIRTATQNNAKLTEAAMKNLWALVQDNEYVLAKLYEDYELFPKVYGTCGGLYAVEHLEPLTFPSIFGKSSFSQWSVHVSVALAILEFLDELESVFQHPIFLCDIKPSHFGISDDGKIKFLDLDAVFQKSMLDKMMMDTVMCEKHSDCHFFDCKGQCDLINEKCVNGVVNNNLQVICEKIFLKKRFSDNPDRIFSSGFLESKHMNIRLQKVLNHCANPTGSEDETRIGADADVKMELYAALKEVLDIARKLEDTENDLRKSNTTKSKS